MKTIDESRLSSEKEAKELFDFIETNDKDIHSFLSLHKNYATDRFKPNGFPIAIKSNINIKGEKITAGSRILENYIAPYDATVIEKLKKSDAIIVGTTNMDEFAMGSSTENSAFGPTKNPRDLSRVPGGSSGGSAAAAAAGFVSVALGSDTGGSIRQPAALCGVIGFKPTYGEVSRYGLIAMASSLDQIGVFATNINDVKFVFDIIRGEDKRDATSQIKDLTCLPARQGLKIKETKNNKIMIGIPKGFAEEGLDDEVKKAWENTLKTLTTTSDVVVEPVSLPHLQYSLAVYYIIMPVEVASNLARYDGIRFGKSREFFGAEAKRRIILGTFASSAGYADQYYNQAQKIRALIKADFDKAFDKIDFILTPTSPTVAWKIGEKTNDPLKMYLSDIFTVPANLAGLPAISLPVSVSRGKPANPPAGGDGLPVGIQLIGPQFSDDKLLDFCQKIEKGI